MMRQMMTSARWPKQAAAAALAAAISLALPGSIFPELTPVRAAHAQASDVVLENLTLKAGPAIYTIPRLVAKASTLNADELKALLSGTTADYVGTLSRFDAASLTAPEITITYEMFGVSFVAAYRDVALESISKGKIASAVSLTSTFDSKAPADAPPELAAKGTTGKTVIKDMDLTALARVLYDKQSGPDQPLMTLYSAFSADDTVLTSGVSETRIAAYSGSGFRARPMKTPLIQALANLPKPPPPPAPGQPPQPMLPQDVKMLLKLMGELYRDFAFDRFEMTGMQVLPKQGLPDLPPVSVKVAKLSGGGFGDAKLAEFAYEGLELGMPDGSLKVGKIGMKDLDMKALIAFFDIMADQPLDNPAALDAFMATLNPREFIPSLGQLVIAGLDLDAPDPGNPGGRTKLSMGLFDLQASNWLKGIPTQFSMTLDKLSLPINKNDLKMEALSARGIERLELSSKAAFAWNEAAQEIAINSLSIDAGQLGTAGITGRIGNIPRELFETDAMTAQFMLMNANLKSLGIDIKNSGLFDVILAQSAKDQGISVEEAKGLIIAGVSVGLPMALGNSDQGRQLSAALAKFIADPKSLRLKAEAAEGVGITEMMMPEILAQKLKIEAIANE